MTEKSRTLTYRFILKDGDEKVFTVRLQPPGMRLEPVARDSYPDWTKLDFQKCPNCPLDSAKVPRCPAATSIVDVVEFFKDFDSYEVVELRIATEEREYSAKKSVQSGLSSLIGLHMAAGGCPVLDQLRPMVYTHLPFPTLGETVYRALSMYLVAQYLRHKRGQKADWDLKGLAGLYQGINAVNTAFIKRLTSFKTKDATLNAVAGLDCLASYAAFTVKKDSIKELDELFETYLR